MMIEFLLSTMDLLEGRGELEILLDKYIGKLKQ
jgi:hypothetical protein